MTQREFLLLVLAVFCIVVMVVSAPHDDPTPISRVSQIECELDDGGQCWCFYKESFAWAPFFACTDKTFDSEFDMEEYPEGDPTRTARVMEGQGGVEPPVSVSPTNLQSVPAPLRVY